MALMMVVMVVLLLVGGHHRMTGSHETKPSAADAAQHMQAGDATKAEEEKR